MRHTQTTKMTFLLFVIDIHIIETPIREHGK